MMRTPEFWYPEEGRHAGPLPWLLAPFAACFIFAGWLRQRFVRPCRASVPVICIGNLTAGGAGKTPAALALMARLRDKGIKAHFLTRGYGGHLSGPVRVDQTSHGARDTGDEALLLAASAPCWVARNRKAGALAAASAGAELLILDDGFQDPHLEKDLSILLIDAQRGFGNGWVMPSGPLREPIQNGLARADAVVIIGDGGNFSDFGKPRLHAHRQLCNPEALRGRKIYAFCGIGAPQQFFEMLRNAGAVLTGTQMFPDHHPFTDQQINAILARAEEDGAAAVTTQKDWVRLGPAARQRITAIGMEMVFDDEAALAQLLEKVLHNQA